MNYKTTLPLTALKVGKKAIIQQLIETENAALCRRLLELGFTPGQEVTLFKQAPGKGTFAVKVGGRTFALRAFEAALLLVNSQ